MHKPVILFSLAASIIAAFWWWLGAPVPASSVAAGPDKLFCISYAPFRGAQTPLDPNTRISAAQIDQDLERLAKITDCIRTYSVDVGLDQVPEIAKRHGLKVLLGLWVSSHADRTQVQITTGVALANRFPDVVRGVVVGNEALLRGEVSAATLGEIIRGVKARVKVPVTYADVWEFWLKHAQLADAVDFITIHILPYWEDDPIHVAAAADHVASIRKRVADAFFGKEILIGEFGWPSAGRMREGALPSPVNQARAIAEVIDRGRRDGFRTNIIEAFDQPWKRLLEGTVGGHWGIFDDASRSAKFSIGRPVSNHPHWRWQAGAGIALATAVFGAAFAAARGRAIDTVPPRQWLAVAMIAVVAGLLIGWTVQNIPVESLGVAGWLRSLAFAAVAILGPLLAAAAVIAGLAVPPFARVIGAATERRQDALGLALGLTFVAICLLALQAALALSFDPRYRDFPFAPLTAAAVPFLVLAWLYPAAGAPALSERIAAAMLALCAAFILWNETLANWQAVWFAAAVAVVAVTLTRARDARG